MRDGREYAPGASDDKGNFLPLLHAACELHRAGALPVHAGALPVHVRVLVEGEEEIGSTGVARWLRDDRRGADCAIVFDAGMADEATPAITVGLRGMARVHVTVTTGQRDVHSGVYGGSVVNALHVLHAMLAAVLPGPDGTLRAGIEPPDAAELASWARLASGDSVLAASGALPLHPAAGAEYYARNGADTSLVSFVPSEHVTSSRRSSAAELGVVFHDEARPATTSPLSSSRTSVS